MYVAENTIDLFRRKLFTNVIIFYQELENMFMLACMTFQQQGLDFQSFIIPRPFTESVDVSTYWIFPKVTLYLYVHVHYENSSDEVTNFGRKCLTTARTIKSCNTHTTNLNIDSQ